MAIFSVLYNISLQLIYFTHSSLYLLISYLYLPSPFPLPTGNCQFDFCICECASFLLYSLVSFHFFLFFFNGHPCSIWKFPVQGLNWSCSCSLCHSHGNTGFEPHPTYVAAWGNARSLIHWARPGIKPASSQKQRQVLNLLSHRGNSCFVLDSTYK